MLLMDNESSNSLENLRRKFPEMRPVKAAPWLGSANGFGLGLYGRRDFDSETQTYVKTRCICVFFIPLLALGAYRVADAGQRTWFFYGREPVSLFAKIWNGITACAFILLSVSVGWHSYISSPGHTTRQELARAGQFLKSGQTIKAAGIYRRLLIDGMPFPDESRNGLRQSLEKQLQSDSAEAVEGAFRLLVGFPSWINQPPLIPDAAKQGLALVDKFRSKDPEGALRILDLVGALATKKETIDPLRIELLTESIAANPNNTNRVVELALIYEAKERLEDCYKLLLPYQHKLGSTEGARILGQHLLSERKNDEAYELLYPYVQNRLEKLRSIERAYTNAMSVVSRRALNDLNQSKADPSFYNAYNKASKIEKESMVDSYIAKELQNDPAFRRAVADFKAANKVVNVTLDLGMVQLSRAQDLRDPEARKKELEAAEKTFLAIRGLAGQKDEYRLFLGQVYYWLGRSKEGKDLFDQLLASNKRAYWWLISLGRTLRDVGDLAQARALVEEAYNTGRDNSQKYSAASFRAFMFKDTDDQIAWLEKADPAEPNIQIALNCARGEKALQQGQKEIAAQYLRKAVDAYALQPKGAVVLNNWGLACLSLYEATGNRSDHNRGLALLEEAISLAPGDSVLLINTLQTLLTSALMDVVRDSIRVESLGEAADTTLLSHLYSDEAGRKQLYQRLHDLEAMKKALGYLEKALLLAPKSLALYQISLHYQGGFQDLAELQKLQQRFRTADPDLSELQNEELAAYQGKKDGEYLDRYRSRIRILEKLSGMPAIKEHPVTLEHVQVSLSGLKQNAFVYGEKIDGTRLLEDAKAADARHQSAATHSSLVSAHFFCAREELSQQDQRFAELAEKTRRVLSPHYLITLLMERGGALSELIRKNANVLSAVALEKESSDRFPSFPRIDTWALLRTVDPGKSAKIGEQIKTNQIVRVTDQLELELNPLRANAVIDLYWTQRMLGNETGAAEIYDGAIARGVPLPPRLPGP